MKICTGNMKCSILGVGGTINRLAASLAIWNYARDTETTLLHPFDSKQAQPKFFKHSERVYQIYHDKNLSA